MNVQTTPYAINNYKISFEEEEEELTQAKESKAAEAKAKTKAGQARLIACDLEGFGPPSAFQLENQEIFDIYQTNTRKFLTKSSNSSSEFSNALLKSSAETHDRLSAPLLNPYNEQSLDYQDLNMGELISGAMITTKFAIPAVALSGLSKLPLPAMAGVFAVSALLVPAIDVFSIGIDASLEAMAPSLKKTVDHAMESFSKQIDQSKEDLENNYGVPQSVTEDFYKDVASLALAGTMTGVLKTALKLKGMKPLKTENSAKPFEETPPIGKNPVSAKQQSATNLTIVHALERKELLETEASFIKERMPPLQSINSKLPLTKAAKDGAYLQSAERTNVSQEGLFSGTWDLFTVDLSGLGKASLGSLRAQIPYQIIKETSTGSPKSLLVILDKSLERDVFRRLLFGPFKFHQEFLSHLRPLRSKQLSPTEITKTLVETVSNFGKEQGCKEMYSTYDILTNAITRAIPEENLIGGRVIAQNSQHFRVLVKSKL